MKNTNYIINGVLAVAVIILFILFFTNKKNGGNQVEVTSSDSTYTRLPVAYINSDTLISNYNFAKDLNESISRKAENSRAIINQKMQQFQKEYLEFQQKKSLNAYLSTDRERQEADRLGKKQQDLDELAARMQDEFATEQMKANQQLSDTIIAALKIYNQPQKYQIIFSNLGRTSTILIADDVYDITKEVTDFLNKRYVPSEK